MLLFQQCNRPAKTHPQPSKAELRLAKDVDELSYSRFTVGRTVTKINFPEGALNLTNFTCTICPQEGVYEGGSFKFAFTVPSSYPFSPPRVRCLSRVFHPNIDYTTGVVSLAVLKQDSWNAVFSINTVLFRLQHVFVDPTVDLEHAITPACVELIQNGSGCSGSGGSGGGVVGHGSGEFKQRVQQTLLGGEFFGIHWEANRMTAAKLQGNKRLRSRALGRGKRRKHSLGFKSADNCPKIQPSSDQPNSHSDNSDPPSQLTITGLTNASRRPFSQLFDSTHPSYPSGRKSRKIFHNVPGGPSSVSHTSENVLSAQFDSHTSAVCPPTPSSPFTLVGGTVANTIEASSQTRCFLNSEQKGQDFKPVFGVDTNTQRGESQTKKKRIFYPQNIGAFDVPEVMSTEERALLQANLDIVPAIPRAPSKETCSNPFVLDRARQLAIDRELQLNRKCHLQDAMMESSPLQTPVESGESVDMIDI